MTGNTIGKLFTVTSFGESHGAAIGCIVDGCPSRLALCEDDIQQELNRRRPGHSHYTSQRQELDQIKILSGVFEGQTTGTPIGLMIENIDAKTKDYDALQSYFRPGHADYTYQKKYGIRDHRGGGRASARETAMRVAAGAIAKKYLALNYNIQIRGYLAQIGHIKIEKVDWDLVNQNPFFCPDENKISLIEELIKQCRKDGDSIGAMIHVEANNVPPGLGEPIFDRLDAELAYALMSINAVKGVEIGAGFQSVRQRGSEHRDEITPDRFLSNNAGGILGGISTGQAIIANVAFKPTSSIRIPAKSINQQGETVTAITTGRHDPCVGIRATSIVEAMVAIILMDHVLRWRGYS